MANDDPKVWSYLTGLPVTKVEVTSATGEPTGILIDGQEVYENDTIHLTVGEALGHGNGIYTVTSVEEPTVDG